MAVSTSPVVDAVAVTGAFCTAARAASRRRSSSPAPYQTTTGASEIARPKKAQVRIATWVWPRTKEAASEVASTPAQHRWTRKVRSRSALASAPLGVMTKRQGRRSTAAPSDLR